MSLIEELNAEELASLAYFLGIALAKSFNEIELGIIDSLLLNIANVIETILAVKGFQAVLKISKTNTDPSISQKQQQEIGDLINDFSQLVETLQAQNECLQLEIEKLKGK